jgi:hypothetical protein
MDDLDRIVPLVSVHGRLLLLKQEERIRRRFMHVVRVERKEI